MNFAGSDTTGFFEAMFNRRLDAVDDNGGDDPEIPDNIQSIILDEEDGEEE